MSITTKNGTPLQGKGTAQKNNTSANFKNPAATPTPLKMEEEKPKPGTEEKAETETKQGTYSLPCENWVTFKSLEIVIFVLILFLLI